MHDVTQTIASMLKAIYPCDGVSTRQHNEGAGDQTVWNFHVHVIPCDYQDNIYRSNQVNFPEPEQLRHAQMLREYVQANKDQLFQTKVS